MIKKFGMYACMLLAVGFTACDDTDDLEKDIQALTDRVSALEDKVALLNGNVQALSQFYKEGVVISKVDGPTDGVFTLTLSNGKVMKLAQWVEGFGAMPMVGVSTEGYWQVSYDKGATWKPVLKGGQPVLAEGNNGKTPGFRVNQGFWEVDANGDGTFEQVKDEQGQPVKAVYDANGPVQQFTDIQQKGDVLEVTFGNGNKVNVPIVPDFFCYFDAAIQGEQTFKAGETKEFKVHLKGVDQTLVSTPDGWKAELGAAVKEVAMLKVTAPKGVQPAVRATADNLRDIAILAFKGSFATLTKIQVNPIEVEMGGGDAQVEPEKPLEPQQPAIVENLAVVLPHAAGDLMMLSANAVDEPVVMLKDGWFRREKDQAAPLTTYAFDAKEQAWTATVAATKGAWNNSSFGYHAAGTFARATYKLTFQVKGDVESSVGVAIRTAADDRGFRMLKPDGTNWERNVTTPKAPVAWTEVSILFDLTHASEAMTSTALKYSAKEGVTTEADVKGINLYFYNNKVNTQLFVKDIQLVKQP